MELGVVLGGLALLVALVALAVAWQTGKHWLALAQRIDEAEQHLARMEGETHETIADVRAQLGQTSRELSELKAATEVVPSPPLPRARSHRLDDLRERLRAAHREENAESDADA